MNITTEVKGSVGIATLNRPDLCVAEPACLAIDEPLRIYVGYRTGGFFRSVGDYLSAEAGAHPPRDDIVNK